VVSVAEEKRRTDIRSCDEMVLFPVLLFFYSTLQVVTIWLQNILKYAHNIIIYARYLMEIHNVMTLCMLNEKEYY